MEGEAAGVVGPPMGDDLGMEFSPGEADPGAGRLFHHGEFGADALVTARRGRRGAGCLPARNEARTLGPIVSSVRRALTAAGGGADLVDDVVVVDDGSDDDTAAVAVRAGARVLTARTGGGGKGQAMGV